MDHDVSRLLIHTKDMLVVLGRDLVASSRQLTQDAGALRARSHALIEDAIALKAAGVERRSQLSESPLRDVANGLTVMRA